MGWAYEVLAGNMEEVDVDSREVTYRDVTVYEGNSLIKAILAMRKAKPLSGYITLTWR